VKRAPRPRRPRRAARAAGPMERQAHAILAEASRTLDRLQRRGAGAVAAAAEAMLASIENGGTIFFCGNGGSAADAQHLATELAGRYLIDRPPIPAIALTTNTSALTAIGNDYGFAQTFARQLEGLGSPGDVLFAITTSGRSPNVARAVTVAQKRGMVVIGLTGPAGAPFAAECDIALITPASSTPHVQEGHIVMGHAVCELVERALFGQDRDVAARAGGAKGARATRRPKARAKRRSAARPARRRTRPARRRRP
jgi:D-sedoheptulose 7-phosphate isomerase